VEYHPFDYRTFEGVIPKGNYGAGTVMVWDEGTYEPFEEKPKSKADANRSARNQIRAGKIKFVLHGKKLNGTFVLIRARYRGENSWLLMKLKDEYATNADVLEQDTSVLTGRTLDEIAKGVAVKKKSRERRTKADRKPVASKKATRKNAKRNTKPPAFAPMLATLVNKPFDKPGWVYEVKWDGYRTLAFVSGEDVELKSRNNKSFDEKFYPVRKALSTLGIDAVLDGEIVVLRKDGHADFGALQNWRSEADGHLIYYVFDVLWVDGKNVCDLPLTERRKLLEPLIPSSGIIRKSEIFTMSGLDFFDAAREKELEGIIAKRAESRYTPGARSTDWLKIKANKSQEVVIGGYTVNEDTPKAFSALLAGVYKDGKLVYTGKIGTGFNEKLQKELMAEFKKVVAASPPFDTTPDVNKPSRFNPRPPNAKVTWLKPVLVCEVSYAEMTSDGILRHPSFKGMRTDKKAKDVVLEKEKATSTVVTQKAKKSTLTPKPEVTERQSLLNPKDETQVRPVGGQTLKFTNLSKVFWPKERVTKRDVINYYYQIADYILPYLKDRPQSLNRYPNGITGMSFYQKDITGKVPDWVKGYLYHSADEPEVDKHFMVPQGEADLMLMANLGCIEMNPWSSRVDKPDHPDWCIIDLDPDKQSFDLVIEAALTTKAILDEHDIPSYCKTSGSTGLHIYIPMGARFTYEDSKEFARSLVKLVQAEIPTYASIERAVADRKGKMYLDFLQNRPQATLAAPYSIRPKPGAPVSMPLRWDELKKGLKMTDFNIFNAVARVREMGDIFAPVMGKGINTSHIQAIRGPGRK
jgi:bifunctional non-homologous end joining protein LigD